MFNHRLFTSVLTSMRRISTKKFPGYKRLEEEEIKRIQKSWVLVTENEERFLDVLRQDMFCHAKMYELYFNPHKTPGVCVSELPEFKNHPKNIYCSLGSIVQALENENVAVGKMIEFGKRHGKIGVSRKHIGFMTSVIYAAVECAVGPCAFERLVDIAWEKFLTNFNDIVGLTAERDCPRLDYP